MIFTINFSGLKKSGHLRIELFLKSRLPSACIWRICEIVSLFFTHYNNDDYVSEV